MKESNAEDIRRIGVLEAQLASMIGILREEIQQHRNLAINGNDVPPIVRAWLKTTVGIMEGELNSIPDAARQMLARLEASDVFYDEMVNGSRKTVSIIIDNFLEAYRKAKGDTGG